MRIAIISDLHGNLVAFEAALADLTAAEPDQIICLGDVAAIGPQPGEVIARLRELNCPVVSGNHDDWMLDPQPWQATGHDSDRIMEIDAWCLEQLAPAEIAYLRSFQPTIELRAGAMALLCFHGSPRSNTEIIVSTTPEDELEQMLSGCHATALVGGHTHVQMLRRHRGELLINPGSVGMAFQRDSATGQIRYIPRAEYALVSWSEDRLSVELRRVPFDVDLARRAALRSDMPHARWWADAWID
jgi:putative phosphoesterase